MMTTDEFNQIHDLYIDAAQLFPNGDIDADVQVSNFCCDILDNVRMIMMIMIMIMMM